MLQKTDSTRPWAGLQIQVHPNVKALFSIAVSTVVGDGGNTKFWTERWLHGRSVAEVAPHLVTLVPRRVINQRTVQQALENRRWVADIKGALSVQAISEYLQLWVLLEDFELQQGVQDHHVWRFAESGGYSSKSAYGAFFVGSIRFAPWKRVWKTWAPLWV